MVSCAIKLRGDMTFIVLLVFLLPLGLAGTLIVRGVRGFRVGDHPVCRRCAFDLFGQPIGTIVCGECGSSLTIPGSVLIGHRQRRPTFVVAGLIILLPILFVGGTVLWGQFNSVNWLDYAPTRFVIWLAGSSNASRRTPALAELNAEVTAGTLNANEVNRVADAGLAYQADLTKPWDTGWGDLLEKLQGNGKLSDTRWKQYLMQASNGVFALKIRPRVRRGDPMPYVVESASRRASQSGRLWIESNALGIDWLSPHGAVPLRGGLGGMGTALSGSGTSSGGSNINATDLPNDFRDGVQQLRFGATFKVGLPPSSGSGWGVTPIISGQINMTAAFTLLPANQPTVKVINDPSLTDAIRKSLRPDYRGAPWPSCNVNVDGPPVGISFDVFASAGGKETKIGSFACPAGTTAHSWTMMTAPIPVALRSVDMIFRSDIDPALNTIDTFEMWNGEIVFKDVQVK